MSLAFLIRHRNTAYWRKLPLRRMWKLLTAIFFTLATVGFFVDLTTWGRLSIGEALAWVVLVGGFGVGIFIASTRNRRLIPVVVFAYIAALFFLAFRPHTAKPGAVPRAAHNRILFDGVGMLAGSMIGYVLFIGFVNSEGMEMLALRTELELAHRLQHTLVPTIEFNTGDFELYARTIPSEKMGGDLVDAFEASDAVTAYVADVSGHGIPAGTLMAMIKMAGRLFSMQAGRPVDPAALLKAWNESLPFVKEPNMYATAVCITAKDGYASFSTAGHGPILHYSAGTGQMSQLYIEQFPLGIFPGEYRARTSMLEAGDMLVVATDGILEAENAAGEEFGSARLERILLDNAREPPARVFEQVMTAVYRHCPKPADDCSLLIMRYRSAGEGAPPSPDAAEVLLSLKAGLESHRRS